VNETTDQQLLRDYAGSCSENAFAELVKRHIDFVYSAALRMVRDAQLAEDVTQSVFLALAENARQLVKHPVLPGWLHRTTQNLSANAVRADVRRRAREQEAATMNELLSNEPDATYQTKQAATLRTKVQSLEQQQQSTPADQLQQLTRERDEMKRQLAESREEIERLNRNAAELVRLRDEVSRLRTDLANVKSGGEANLNNPMQVAMKSWVERAKTLQSRLKEVPEVCIPEFELLKDVDWLDSVKEFDLNENLQGDVWIRYAAAQLRDAAKGHFAMQLAQALDGYLKANNDELPKELTELKSYFEMPLNDEIIDRYKLIQQGKYSEERAELVTEKSRIANDNTRIEIGRRGYSHANWEISKTPGK
jgi:DNA-directed RNA polymerase specialized sigma24 family protein